MAKKKKGEVKLDFQSFMPILVLTIGCLVVLLVTNTIIIVSNPENVRITSVIRSALWVKGGSGMEGGAPFPFGNKHKEPAYVDVHKDRLVIYQTLADEATGETYFPGAVVVPVRDLEVAGNAFEGLLEHVEQLKDEQYVILLVRPHAASIARRLRKVVISRGLDFGWELFESERPIDYDAVRRTVAR